MKVVLVSNDEKCLEVCDVVRGVIWN
jgi:hypothetical protein